MQGDKHSSLHQKFVTSGRKKFHDLGPDVGRRDERFSSGRSGRKRQTGFLHPRLSSKSQQSESALFDGSILLTLSKDLGFECGTTHQECELAHF